MNVALFSRDVGLHTDASRLIGNLSSTALVPVDVSVKAAPTLRDLAKQLQDAMLNVIDNSICTSGTDAMARLNRRDGTIGRAVAPFVFASVLQEGEGINKVANPFTWYGKTPKHSALTTPQVWLDVQVFNDVDGSLYFNWDAHLERFADGLVNTMFQAFCNLLGNLADEAGCQQALAARPVLPPGSDQMVNRLNNAALRPGLNPQLMHQAILQQAQQTPNAPAIFDDATGQSFTFEKVVKLARCFATAIVNTEEAAYSGSDGLKRKLPGHPVAVYMKKGWQQVF
jgi:pyochelin synthetase